MGVTKVISVCEILKVWPVKRLRVRKKNPHNGNMYVETNGVLSSYS